MLYETLLHPTIFLWMFLSGFFAGFFVDFKYFFQFLTKNNKILKRFFDFFCYFFVFLIYFLFNLNFNYGQIRLFSILSFALALFFERFISKKILAKTIIKCYNKFKGRKNGRKKI